MIEAHKIGISLVMGSNHADVFGALSRSILGVEKDVAKFAKSWDTVGIAIKGAFAVVTGGMILKGLVDIIDKTKELSHEMSQIEKMGINANDRRRAQEEAIAVVSRHPGVTQSDALNIFGRAYSRTGGNVRESLEQMEILSTLEKVLGTNRGDYRLDPNDSKSVFRAAENLGRATNSAGQWDQAKFSRFAGLVGATSGITHGAIGPQDWELMARRGGLAMSGMSDRGLVEMAIAGQYINPSAVGTAEMSLYQQFIGGQMTGKTATELMNLGVLQRDEVQMQGTRVSGISAKGKARMRGVLGESPIEAAEHLLSIMSEHGITDPQKQQEELFNILGRSTTQRLMGEIMRARGQISKEADLIMGAPDIYQQEKIADQKDIGQNIHNLSAAWQELINTIGGPNNENFIAAIKAITAAINEVKEKLKGTDPETIRKIGVGIAAFGGALVAGGAIAMALAMPGGWLVLGIAALAGGLSTLQKPFDEAEKAVQDFGKKIREAIKGWFGGGDSKKSSPGADPLIPYGFTPMSYTTGGDNRPLMLTLNGPTAIAINGQLMGGSAGFGDGFGGGGGGGGGGVTNAAFTAGGYAAGAGRNVLGGALSAGGFSALGGGGAGGGAARVLGGGGIGGGGFSSGGGDVNSAIEDAAKQYGLDPNTLKSIASIESNMNPRAPHPGSQYQGLFQMGHSEWAKYGAGGNIWSAKDSAMAAAHMLADHAAWFKQQYGRDPTPGELYMMHQQGRGFYSRGALTNPGGNPYPGMRGPQTHESFERGWTAEVDRRRSSFANAGAGTAAAGALGAGAMFDPITATSLGGGVGGFSASMGSGRHQGDDIMAPMWSPLFADKDGVIAHIGKDNFGKTAVTIAHPDGTYSRYLHVGRLDASVGDQVKGGQRIGLSGSANGVPHLHFERWQGEPGRRGSRLISPRSEFGWSSHNLPHGGALSPNSPVQSGASSMHEGEHVGGLRAFLGRRQWHGKKSIPDAEGHVTHAHTTLHLDGRKVAQNTTKHINRSMNAASMGSRMPDYSAARPMPV